MGDLLGACELIAAALEVNFRDFFASGLRKLASKGQAASLIPMPTN